MTNPTKVIVAASSLALLSLASLQAQNTVVGTSSGVGSGNRNLIYNSSYAWIGGGFTNVIVNGANFSTIGGGYSNAVRSAAVFATVGGGSYNVIGTNATNAAIAAGLSNVANGRSAFVGSGMRNVANGFSSAVVSGINNQAGGLDIENSESFGFVGAGRGNVASGLAAVVPGGSDNVASETDSFAAGSEAKATNSRSFVWGSDAGFPTTSTNANSFTARAAGGVRFITTATNLVGAILASGATSWAVLSDSNAKTDVEPINAREVLKKVAALPVTSWHYKHDLNRRYIGPMAQDFHAAFGLGGDDDKTITTLDTDGVTLAAIQGLVEELKERDARSAHELKLRDAEIADLKAQMQAINDRLSQLPPSP